MMDVTAKKAKSLKNAERRRERSKVAARCRRGKESQIFSDLSASLPIPESSKSSLDKASIMRLTLCNLKIKKMIESGLWNEKKMVQSYGGIGEEFESQINSALGGFILVFTLEGDVIYASEGITAQLGISQYEVMGQSIFEFSHQYDHNDIRNLLQVKNNNNNNEGQKRSALIRLKCTVSSRGRNAHLRATNYKVVNCVGRIMEGEGEDNKWFISVCEPLLHPSDVDIPLNKQTFLSKHSLDMKFEYVDDSVAALLGYTPEEMMGKSLFEFNHAADGEGIFKSFKSLYEKEQSQTDRYRFLTKGGGWIWVMTQATVIHGNNAKAPSSVVCIHFITSGKEGSGEILSAVQIGEPARVPVKVVTPAPSPKIAKANTAPVASQGAKVQEVAQRNAHGAMSADEENSFIADLLAGPLLNNATCSTSKIFAPRTEDMDTGFLMPVDNNTLIVSKEEPEDLTHLAPIAGDECVPLEVPLLEDLLASLDDNEEFSFLDTDATEIPKFDMPQQQPLKVKPPMSSSSSDSSPMLLSIDPPMVSSPDPALNLFSPYRAAADLPPSPPMPIMEDQFFGNVRIPAASPTPSDLGVAMPMMAIQAQNPIVSRLGRNSQIPSGANFNNGGQVAKPSIPPDPAQVRRMIPQQQRLGAEMKRTSPPPSPDWSLLEQANMLMKQSQESNGPTPCKQQRMGDPSPSRIYILVPVQQNGGSRRGSASSGGTFTSVSDSDNSNDGTPTNGQFSLVDLIRTQENLQQQKQIKEVLANMGITFPDSIPQGKGIGALGNNRLRKRDFTGTLLSQRPLSLQELTRQDCEVNAPLSSNSDLLQGPELLNALETGMSSEAIV